MSGCDTTGDRNRTQPDPTGGKVTEPPPHVPPGEDRPGRSAGAQAGKGPGVPPPGAPWPGTARAESAREKKLIEARLRGTWVWVTDETSLGPLWLQVLVTFEETVGGFAVGSILGVIFGILLGGNKLLAEVFSIYIKAANAIPRVVLGALFAISLGLDIRAKIATASVLVFFVVFFNAFQGVREVDRNLIANARILGADDRRLTTEVIIPSALSWILASLHISFGLALVGAVVGELFGATAGVGELIYYSEAMALLAEALITSLENRLVRWRPPALGSEIQI